MAQQDYSGLIIIGAIGAAAWYAYEQGWFSSLLPTTAPALPAGNAPATTINCPSPGTIVNGVCVAPSAVTPTVSIVNNSGGTGTAAVFHVGDNYTVKVTGTPGAAVSVSGTQNGSVFGPSSQGTIPASGTLVVAGTMPSTNVGPWLETWTVGGVSAGTLSFQVLGGSSNQISTPEDLQSLLAAAAGSGGNFGLDIDQWAYYYAALPGRSAISASDISQMLAASGIPRSTPMDAQQFVGELGAVGLSGIGDYFGIPAGAIHGGW